MSYTEYRETVDYTWVVARQLDRVAEAISRVDPRAPGLGVRRVYVAIRALVDLAHPFINRERAHEKLRRADQLTRANKYWDALDVLEELLGLILEELDRKKLLVRRKEIMGVVEE